MLVSSDKLMKMIKNTDVIVVDCRSYNEYEKGHIPTAVNVNLFNYHWLDTTREGVIAFQKQMMNLLSITGVNRTSTVVFYDDISGMSAARGVWLLNYFSHKHAFMLDGGFKKWTEFDLPIETKTNGFKPTKFDGKINRKILVGYEYLKENLNRVKLIDTRSKEEYSGKVMRAARKGHLPNAINIDWGLNINEDGTMKKLDELERLYPFPKNAEIVTYCQGGYRAANSFVALKLLGFKNVKVYLGSWGEWGNRLELPIED